jgi:autotransporter-associated beta strand protein
LDSSAGANTVASVLSLAADATIGVDAGSLSLATGPGGQGGLTKAGLGTLVLTTAGTYAGSTVILEGALELRNALALGTSSNAVVVDAGAALQLQGGIIFAAPLMLSGS